MRFIVLAAGQGTRLRPLTDNIPKCMVPLEGKPLLERQLETARAVGLSDLHVATGYRDDAIDYPGVTKHHNPAFASTNMVSSLFCAESIMDNDLVVSYGDIVYQPDVLRAVIDHPGPVAVAVDTGWRRYWEARREDPLSDAETMKLRRDGTIIELGKKPTSLTDIEGQYVGLIKFSAEALRRIRTFYHDLDPGESYDGKDLPNMYMTSFLQLIADRLMPLHAVFIRNGWMEIDEPSDFEQTDFLYRRGAAERTPVLHVITRLANGGAGENTLYSVNGLDHDRYAVDLAVGEESEPGLLEKIGLNPAVRLIEVPGLRRDPAPLREAAVIRELRRVIAAGGYRIVHTHGAKAGVLGRIAAARERVPVIINGIHGITFSERMSPVARTIYRLMERRVGRKTTHFVAVGEDLRRKYVAAGVGRPDRYRVIHSGMDVERFRAAAALSDSERARLRTELAIPEGAIVIGKISRLEKRKAYHFFVDAAARILSGVPGGQPSAPALPDLRFLIVGDGPDTGRIASLVAERGLTDSVIFTGYRTDVERIFALCDVVVLTSLWEGLPRVLVQAAAAGKPVVTFDVDGAWEVVREGHNGFVVPSGDVGALADRIARLVTDDDLRARMGDAATSMVDDSWTVDAMVERIEALYAEALAGTDGGAGTARE